MSGYYGALDYAAACWKPHVHQVCRATISHNDLDEETKSTALQSAQDLLEAQERLTGALELGSHRRQDTPSEQLPQHSEAPTLWDFVADDSKSVFVNERVTAIRHIIELIELPSSKAFTELNGTWRFKCPRVDCCKFSDGFPTQQQRQDHLTEHERPFKCSIDGCYMNTIGYSSQKALDTHFKRLHSSESNVEDLFPVSKGTKAESLYTAAANGNLEQVKFFHTSGSPLNMHPRGEGWLTPLIIASRNGHAKVCQYLIQQGESPFFKSLRKGSNSALVEAIKREDFELIQLILRNAKTMPASEEIAMPIAYAICTGRTMAFEQLLADCIAMEWDLDGLLSQVLAESCLISEDIVVENAQMTGLQKSLMKRMIQLVFPGLHDPSSPGSSFKQWSYRDVEAKSQRQRLRELVTRTESESMSFLHRAATAGLYYIIEVLLDFLEEEDILAFGVGGHTLLHYMIPSWLYRRGQDQSCVRRLSAISRVLQETDGVAANTNGGYGWLPLHKAINYDREDIIPLLIQYTTNLNAEDESGETPLELAIKVGFSMGVSLLIKSGRVNLSRTTRDGETMYMLAQRLRRRNILNSERREKIIQLLKPQEESSTEDETERTD